MIQVIETNLKLNESLNNFQSRVIEVEDWDYIISQFTDMSTKHPKNHWDINNRYNGVIVPKMCNIKKLKYDERRLSCDIEMWNGEIVIKMIELFK